MRNVKLLLALTVNKGSRPSSFVVKPGSYIGTCSLDQWFYFCLLPVFLDEGCQVIDVSEEGDPDVVGGVVTLEFFADVEPSFVIGLW